MTLNSKKISIAPLSALGQRRWPGKNISDKSKITINLDYIKRPVSAVADNVEIRNAKKIIIKVKQKLSLIYFMIEIAVYKKIKLEQLRKEIY